MTVAITGATGNMGNGVLEAFETSDDITSLKVLVRSQKKGDRILKKYKRLTDKIQLIIGSLSDKDACEKLVSEADFVVNLAAVIPPAADSNPTAAIECNEKGVATLINTIEQMSAQPKLIHVSTVALYGNRSHKHKWGRVGDPLLPSVFDIYSATKMRSEFRVLESRISCFVILRQTGMLHQNMLTDNINDGLMFHTCFDTPIEWVTAHDSGILINNIIKKEIHGEIEKSFWKKCYNIGGGINARVHGWQTLDEGFQMIGGSIKDFFEPYYNATRNFHCMWYLDSDELDNLFHFRTQSHKDYWAEILRLHPYYKLGKLAPKKLVALFAIKRLLSDKNAPSYWAAHNDEARVTAFFGSMENYKKLCSLNWNTYKLPEKENLETPSTTNFDYGFDFAKHDSEITLQDLQNVAAMHGGKLLSLSYSGDVYEKLDWQTQDEENFSASAYTVLRAGHWYSKLYEKNIWEWDRLSKKDKIFAQIWYDSHEENENYKYFFDENFTAHIEHI